MNGELKRPSAQPAHEARHRCRACDADVGEAKFCPECGEPVPVRQPTCGRCGHTLEGAPKFCPECGDELPLTC